jgi:hypothetical protein
LEQCYCEHYYILTPDIYVQYNNFPTVYAHWLMCICKLYIQF